jgi:hypothetical protein
MGENAFVCWIETSQPWLLEAQLIGSVCLSLNPTRIAATHFTLRCRHSERCEAKG